MRSKYAGLMLLLTLLSPKIAGGQSPPYPIVMVHGLLSDDKTWDALASYLNSPNLGWGEKQVYHVNLSADHYSTNVNDDVTVFSGNVLSAVNLFALNFFNYRDQNGAWHFYEYENFYYPNTLLGDSESNWAAIVKQSLALKLAIAQIRQATGADKVILLGHSMGGLAAREYLQRRDQSGKPRWWVDPNQPDGHKVAKLITLGTPHLGSNAYEFLDLIFNGQLKSEAVRDLRYSYGAFDRFDPDSNRDVGVYLFGGAEVDLRSEDFFNTDVNGNGMQDVVEGINSGATNGHFNPQLPLPSNVFYTWVVSDDGDSKDGDDVVRRSRQYLYNLGDTLMTDKEHSDEPKDFRVIIRALDEPNESNLAYQLSLDKPIHGFADHPSSMGVVDHDWFRFTLPQPGAVEVSLNNITPIPNFTNMVVELYNNSNLTTPLTAGRNTGGTSGIRFIMPALNAGEYLLHLRGVVADRSREQPYILQVRRITQPTAIVIFATPNAIQVNGAAATLFAELRDAQGNINPVATNPVTFAITSGAASATLVGPNPVNAVNGVATTTLQSTTTPGLVTIQASSPGLASGTTTVSVYSNPTLVFGPITINTTWTLAKSPYRVTEDIDVRAGVTLTIAPGVAVMFDNARDMTVNGTLLAVGNSGQHISFTSSSANPVIGSWGGLQINRLQGSLPSQLSYCDFSYGGAGNFSYDDVLEIHGYAEPQITACTIRNCRRNGVDILAGRYDSNFQLNITGLPLMLDDMTISPGAVMTIAPGVHIKFADGANISVEGGLLAKGTPAQRIIFTSVHDDATDGDTDGNGVTAGKMGDWGGIYFDDTIDDANCGLEYCDLKFAGRGGFDLEAPIQLDARANPRFQSLRFTNCRYNGIDIQAGDYATNIMFNQTAAPYILRSDLSISQGAGLTIAPGTLFKMTGGVDFYLNGMINCQGAAGNPIRFTSMRDDSRGGDTGNDGQTTGQPGDWGGLFLSATVQSGKMQFGEFHYGGGGGFGNVGNPIRFDLRAEVTFANLTFNTCTSNGIALHAQRYESDVRLRFPGQTAYLQFGDISIAPSATLTIEPGCLIKLSVGSDLYIDGGLKAEGTSSAPITFTSIADDSLLGDSNNDGRSAGVPGGWGGIAFSNSAADTLSRLRHCQFRFGGGAGFGNVGWVLRVSPLVNPAFSNLRFVKNHANGIHLAEGSFTTAILFDQTAAPYLLAGDYVIEASGGLTIAPGTLLKCYNGSDIDVKSRLRAIGTAVAPIIFTSFQDDRFGGDSNNDGASLGVPGDWGGIIFESQSTPGASDLAYCHFWYGASAGFGNSNAAIYFKNSSQKVRNILIRQTRWHGIFAEGTASPDLGGGAYLSPGQNSFLDFNTAPDRYAVFNDGNATIFAKNNTWDGSTAVVIAQDIYDKTDNASKGQVIFDPFLLPGDNEAPQMTVLFPNGGETLLRGQVATLRWFARDNVGVTKIEVALSRDGGQLFQPLTSLTTQEEYKWNVIGPFSSRCILKMTGRDAAGNERFDLSDNFFAIVDSSSGLNYPPSVPLPLRPLAGEEMRGSDLLIWQASVDPNPFDEIRYRLEIDNNADFASPELVEENIDSSRTSIISEKLKAAFASGSVIAIRLDKLAGFANLRDDAVYYWRLRARDRQNAASAFTAGTARFYMNKTNTPPLAVTAGFSPANNVEVRAARPTVSWQAADDPDPSDGADVLRYLLQMDDDGEFAADVEISAQTPAGVTFYIPTRDLKENARYTYRVQASDDENAVAPWSVAQNFFVNAVKEPPRTFAIRAPAPRFVAQSDSVIFQWDATTDPDPLDGLRYVVEWSLNQNFSPGNRLSYSPQTTRITFMRPGRADSVFWRLSAVDADTLSTYASNSLQQPRVVRWQTTAVHSRDHELPTTFMLAPNYPNPFNPETTIEFALPKSERVLLRIFDVHGREVRRLLSWQMNAGHHTVIWNGHDENGQLVASGVFIAHLRAGKFVQGRKMLLVR